MTAINPSRLDRKHRLKRFAVREHGGNILFMLPAFALFAFVVLIPFLQSIPTSFTDKKAIFAKEWNFVGFENYGKLLKSASFRDSFLHTFQFTIVYIIGANMLDKLGIYRSEALVRTAYEICRWHHERWDGRGYPDGLSGDRIPISAQVVSMADVYDALVSKRVYKAAYAPGTAVQMILHGDCGTFNPLLLECLVEIQDVLKEDVTEVLPN